MTSTSTLPRHSGILYVDDQPLFARRIDLLDVRRTIYRLELEPDLCPSQIPPHVNTVIIKRQKDGWEKCFRNEQAAYEKLSELQGSVIPKLYGQVIYDGQPALVLSDEDGLNLHELASNLDNHIDYDNLEIL
ncbi:uncharacterized protein N7483_002197 [Penicillium malachiteum]|uniref:uncharacterized protein n=1 Tax=Penicillium malachiteum TaxID=1324776 RepID=UPI002546D44D|nr:uncharacterized protein N7483_002197 [Penicillium malachiteum]KAJ5737072.1 hypothetical protein N7483_002197 [Penicillium malachiteum]